MNIFIRFIVFVFLCLFISCSDDDNSVTPVSGAPTFLSTSLSLQDTVFVGELYQDTLRVLSNNEQLEYSVETDLQGVIVSDSIVSWTPQPSDVGTNLFTAIVSNLHGKSDTLSWTVTVISDLLAYYPFNNSADDESGNENHATVQGARLSNDRYGNDNSSYHFDGSDDLIKTVVEDPFSVTNLTISVWIAIEGSGTDNPRIIGVGPSGTSHQYYAILLKGTEYSRNVLFMSDIDGDEIEYPSLQKLDANNTWYHIAVTYTPDTVSLYVNGILDNSYETIGSLTQFHSESRVLQIGHSDDYSFATDLFCGMIDDIRIYNRALSASEVDSLFKFDSK